MENENDGGDDKGSGWHEVKKRNRTGSKASTQVGGSSKGAHSASPHSHGSSLHVKFGNLIDSQKSPPSHLKAVSGNASSVLSRNGDSFEKPTISQEAELGIKTIQKVEKRDLGKVLKIKWGDLEDDVFAPQEICGSSDAVTAKATCYIAADNMVGKGEAGNADDGKMIVMSADVEQFPDGMLCSAVQENTHEGTWKEVGVVPSEDKGLSDDVGNVTSSKDVNEDSMGVRNEDMRGLNTDYSLSSAIEDVGNTTARSDDGTLDVPEVPVMKDPVLPPNELIHSSTADGGSAAADMEKIATVQNSSDGVGLSRSQLEGDLQEGEAGESKERFRQRLWCFLFENLNRAVDELYLLCELECDLEQMKEAILVLEEAGSDFVELKCRVEGFENTKRNSQSFKDGVPANMNADHRRPHALSWEVRRMTTSPHRAEILSSSLEAFRKIQQERASRNVNHDAKDINSASPSQKNNFARKRHERNGLPANASAAGVKPRKQGGIVDLGQGSTSGEKKNAETYRLAKAHTVQNGRPSEANLSRASLKDGPTTNSGRSRKETTDPISEKEKHASGKDKVISESRDTERRHNSLVDKEKEKEKQTPWRSMNAWKEKRNWEDILASPLRSSSRTSHVPGMSRKSAERARVLHDKLISPDKKKKTALDMKKEAEEKHARAMRIRSELENERVQRLQRTSEKLNRVNEWQAVRNLKLREGMYARQQRSESRHEAYLAQVVRRAGDESSKVNEVRFITSLNEENKKFILRQKLHDSEMRRAEKLRVIKSKQKEDTAREEAVLERRKLLEAEKLQRLAETQRKKEEAQLRREEERKASSAAREARVLEQLRRKEERAKAQQEEAELLAQKLAERLRESEQRRKFYLEQIREKASMDFRDQSSPSLRRSSLKEGQGKSTASNNVEDNPTNCISGAVGSPLGLESVTLQQSLKRRIKKIRQKLMSIKYEFTEPPLGVESVGIGSRTLVGAARAKIGRWLQNLQKLRQDRKEGAASIGLIVGDIVKFLEGKDTELHASRQAGLLDFIASALPASHTSRPEVCQVTLYLLRLLRVLLSLPANRSYFLAQNLLPPVIPLLSASLENYIKIAASSNLPGSSNSSSNKALAENLDSIAEVLDGFLWTVTTIIGHVHSDERQIQMQDGLIELIIAYQVIHRLRDLFSLYDRPQVEGYPFPSSILLSLNLLAVLTSRPGTISSIDWGGSLSKSGLTDTVAEADIAKSPDAHMDSRPSLVHQNSDPSIPHVISDIVFEESNHGNEGEASLPNEQSPKDLLNRSANICDDATIILDTTTIPMESPVPQSDKISSVNECVEHTNPQKEMDRSTVCPETEKKKNNLKQPLAFLVSAISETGLVSLPSLLTAVLLQANSRLSSEQGSYILPSNFEEVATGVLKVLNNLALLDISVLQSLLARPDLKMEFFHLMSFLLSHCTSKWKTASDQVGLLLLESLLLLGYFALFHPENQVVLRWGKSPTILHKVCDLPFVFFSDPELTPILAGTLLAACYGSEQNRGVVQQELSMDMLLSLLKSCKQELISVQSDTSPQENSCGDDSNDSNQTSMEPKKTQVDILARSNRPNARSIRNALGKGAIMGSSVRVGKVKNMKDSRGNGTCHEWALKHNLPASRASANFMLHIRFPSSFIDKAEEFFSSDA
ncbi:hypothetical protein QJS10_CPA05g01789 [Acorus calamus]|uniref:S phase cyclin A-associated protein in the endoplasmic reticulum N-terminal domain-containing protein n=1 Tax=Acorus calamus TaxID=4465 RepID=A0AAV9ETW4_ACOCL|nr:hypothetical protein QJS10_CPA05g01789 [Acorus calamus]